MGRYLSEYSGSRNIGVTTATKVVPAGYMGEFGNGLWQVFSKSGTFTVPGGVSKIRVRVIAGGAGSNGNGYGGGGGGGYAHGVFDVVPGQSYAVTVGAGGAVNQNGGSSSFGALISATGGQLAVGTTSGGLGGTGSGGDFQAKGGKGGKGGGSPTTRGGGGAAGSQLGDGGDGAAVHPTTGVGGGGGGVGGGHAVERYGGSPFGIASVNSPAPNITGQVSTTTTLDNPINATIRFPFDGFTGGGGIPSGGRGGIGAGASGTGEHFGGACGGGSSAGGGGGCFNSSPASTADAGQSGAVIVEW